ncbi:MFS transporter, ACDE family, multidrug resistance protein [Fontibacillus panacisegetis]|uniref:MFS transporter, ACDE family, multidrug resistance protein n=1 Tax=Fontibacillus panacisegetis TaxID=670482 RepID=A0A1G7NVR2_9BACL|nr:MFS transporter [Fontibacillus panacisegetis]SDF78033.1 MFS transporter, ACDE family, multidrug resistance protein [Fontibacillus panacisegetis]
MDNKKGDMFALASIPLIMTLGNSMLIPILPEIARELKISSLQVSMLITVYAVVAILLIPVAGYLSDKFGRKVVIIPSLIIAGIGGGVSGAASWLMDGTGVYWIILAGRFLQGIGAAGAFPIVLPLVGDMFDDEKQISHSLGIIETSNTFGKVLSPIFGALLGTWIWYMPFLAIPVLCLISLLLVSFLVQEPERKASLALKEFIHSVKEVFKEKGRWLYAIFAIGGICMFLLFGVLFYLSETLEKKHHLDGIVKGLVLAIPLAALCLASYFTGKKIGKNKLLMKWCGVIGLVMSSAALFGISFFNNIYYVIGCLIVCGIGIGTVLPSSDALITEGIEKGLRGTVTSIYSSMRFIGVSLGPPIMSLLMGAGHMTMFISFACVSIVAVVLLLLMVQPQSSAS